MFDYMNSALRVRHLTCIAGMEMAVMVNYCHMYGEICP